MSNRGFGGGRGGPRKPHGKGDPEEYYNVKQHKRIHAKERYQLISALTTTTINGGTFVIVGENNKIVVYGTDGQEMATGAVEGKITAMTAVENILVVAVVMKTEKCPVEVGMISLLNISNNLSLESYLLDSFGRFSHKSEVSVLSSGDVGGVKKLLSGSSDGLVKVWSPGSTGMCAQTIEANARRVKGIKIVHDRLYSAGSDGTISIWNLSSGTPVGTNIMVPQQLCGFLPNGEPYELVGLEVAPTPDGRVMLLSGASDGSIKVLDVSNPDAPSVLGGRDPNPKCGQKDQMTCIKFINSQMGPCLACGYYDSSFIIRNLLQADFGAVASVTPKGGGDKTVRAVVGIATDPTETNTNTAFVIRTDYRLLYYEFSQQS